MNDSDAELKRLAEAATPGPWHASKNIDKPTEGTIDVFYSDGTGEVIARLRYSAKNLDPNLASIAAANPATVLRLLAEKEEAIAERDELLNQKKSAEPLFSYLRAENWSE